MDAKDLIQVDGEELIATVPEANGFSQLYVNKENSIKVFKYIGKYCEIKNVELVSIPCFNPFVFIVIPKKP